MKVSRRALGGLLLVGVSLGLTGCGNAGNSQSIASILNSSVSGDVSVESTELGVTFHRNFILGTSVDIGGSITYSGLYSDELDKRMKDTIEDVVETTSKVANIERGNITFEGVSGSKKVTAAEAYYGETGKKLKVQDVLDDLDSK